MVSAFKKIWSPTWHSSDSSTLDVAVATFLSLTQRGLSEETSRIVSTSWDVLNQTRCSLGRLSIESLNHLSHIAVNHSKYHWNTLKVSLIKLINWYHHHLSPSISNHGIYHGHLFCDLKRLDIKDSWQGDLNQVVRSLGFHQRATIATRLREMGCRGSWMHHTLGIFSWCILMHLAAGPQTETRYVVAILRSKSVKSNCRPAKHP